jgi:hypothetical protein
MRIQQLLPKGIWLIPAFLLFSFFNAIAQNETGSIPITGKVTDEKGNGVPGATVEVKGTTRSASAKEDGSFSLNVVTGKETLVISSVGYTRKEFPLNGETSVVIQLTSAKNTTLDDVVVIGYGTQKRRNVTAATASFDASKLD